MKRLHHMLFGAQLVDGGGTRFRLWAPNAQRIDLLIQGDTRAELPMRAIEGGWYETVVNNLGAGTRYAYRVDGGMSVPDPASRSNPDDVHDASEVVDPSAFEWDDEGWRGRPWEEAVIYELHLGTFTPEGTFAAAQRRLDYLVDLGITVIEVMPIAQYAGRHGWGYDGVLPFAPDNAYGSIEDVKAFVQAAHQRGLMVILDVVYNHFGPEGNYLHTYAESFFNPKHQTPWGAAISYDGPRSAVVRDYFIHNALYWLEEFHFDGLRLDAIHSIADDSEPHFVRSLAEAVHEGPGLHRHVHLILENDRNEAHFLGRDHGDRPLVADAQWNDDMHHALHVLITGEKDGYYVDYADRPLIMLGRCLAEGFAYQGEPSRLREGEARGEPCLHLPATAFINFLQNHDQIGNRAYGERLGALAPPEAIEAALACLLLSPSIPMLFMGEEFDASAPFLFFCDFGPDLAAAVTNGRRAEFGRFARFADPAAQATIPDPNALETFERSKIDWQEMDDPRRLERLKLHKRLLELRHRYIVPRLSGIKASGAYVAHERSGLLVHWTLGDGARLHLSANFSAAALKDVSVPPGHCFYATPSIGDTSLPTHQLPPWSLLWTLEMPNESR